MGLIESNSSDGEVGSQSFKDDDPYHIDNPIHDGPPHGVDGMDGLELSAVVALELGNTLINL